MTPAVDVFNAGCLIYHILTDGYFPFGSRTERRMYILRRAKPDLNHVVCVYSASFFRYPFVVFIKFLAIRIPANLP